MNNNPVIIDTDPGIDDAWHSFCDPFEDSHRRHHDKSNGNATVWEYDTERPHGSWLCKRNEYVSIKEQVAAEKRVHDCGMPWIDRYGNFSIDLPKMQPLKVRRKFFLPKELSNGKRTLLCLSPLTNLAQALRLIHQVSPVLIHSFSWRSFQRSGMSLHMQNSMCITIPMHLMSS